MSQPPLLPGFVRCPDCQAPVLRKNVARHSLRVHGGSRPTPKTTVPLRVAKTMSPPTGSPRSVDRRKSLILLPPLGSEWANLPANDTVICGLCHSTCRVLDLPRHLRKRHKAVAPSVSNDTTTGVVVSTTFTILSPPLGKEWSCLPPNELVACATCGKINRAVELPRHFREQHGVDPYSSSVDVGGKAAYQGRAERRKTPTTTPADSVAPDPALLTRHPSFGAGGESVQCPECSVRVLQKNLVSHRQRVHEPRRKAEARVFVPPSNASPVAGPVAPRQRASRSTGAWGDGPT
jgi:hypothetical protein